MAGIDPRLLGLQASPVVPRAVIDEQRFIAAVNVACALITSPAANELADKNDDVRQAINHGANLVKTWLTGFRIETRDE